MLRRITVRSPLTVAALAAVSVTAMAGIASAATPVRSAAPVAQQAPATTTVASKHVKHIAREAFSAGIAGYDDATCAQLLSDLKNASGRAGDDLVAGDQAGFNSYSEQANHIADQMFDNCAVIT